MKYQYEPSDASIIVIGDEDGSAYDPDSMQTFQSAHHGSTRSHDFGDEGHLSLLSAFCGGCGERQIQLTMKGKNGKVQWVKIRPTMAVKLAELLLIHAKAGTVAQ